MPDFPNELKRLKQKVIEIEKRLEEAEKITKRLKIEGDRVFVKVGE